jgi:hypothetical protein
LMRTAVRGAVDVAAVFASRHVAGTMLTTLDPLGCDGTVVGTVMALAGVQTQSWLV